MPWFVKLIVSVLISLLVVLVVGVVTTITYQLGVFGAVFLFSFVLLVGTTYAFINKYYEDE